MNAKYLIIVVGILLFSCKQNNDSVAMQMKAADLEVADSTTYFQEDKNEEQQQQPEQKDQKQSPDIVAKVDWDKKIIKNARLQAEVTDHKVFSKELSQKVKQSGGYIAGEEQTTNEERIATTVTIKVPVAQFENAVSQLLTGVTKVEEKQVTSDDVTSEYIDGKARLEAKKAVRLRYLELLKAAKNMEDIIAVQKEINEIQEEIELVTGRINYLGQSSAMSTIQFTFYQVLHPGATDDRNSFVQKFKAAFANGWQGVGEVMIGLTAIWPLIVLGCITLVIYRRRSLLKFK